MDFCYIESKMEACKRIRHDAVLGKFEYERKVSDICDQVNHFFEMLDFCDVTIEDFIKNYLSNVQPAMVLVERYDLDSTGVVICTPFAVNLCVWLSDKNEDKDLVVRIERERENGWIYESSHYEGKQFILTDSIEARINGDDNLYSIRVLIPIGILCVPISVTAVLDVSGSFICENKDILVGMKKWVDDYIHDLYASNIEIESMDDVDVFKVEDTVDLTDAVATYVSRLSILIENMYVNEHSIHRKSAVFALPIYAVLLQLSYAEKDSLILEINEKYKDNGKDTVVNFLIDLLSKYDDYLDYCDYKYGDYRMETNEMKFIWGLTAFDDLASTFANLYSMNDIELIYFKETDEYIFSWEGIYVFEKSKHAIRYYKRLIKVAKEWMISNGYDVSHKPEKTPKRPCRTIEDAYWKFHKQMKKKIKSWK